LKIAYDITLLLMFRHVREKEDSVDSASQNS
jgi:hypothetical protein